MSLFEGFNSVQTWKYYHAIEARNYESAARNPIDFIEQYFGYGGKADFLLDSVYATSLDRAKHVVNTYFLGLYLMEKLLFLQPHKELKHDRKILWAWFLCALYHDAFFDAEEVDVEDISYDYCKFSENLLYSPMLLEKYFKKNAEVKTSYDGKIHYDHGIVAASKLYKNYVQSLNCAIQCCGADISDFFTDGGVRIGESLKINHETFSALCKVAKIIACHNIFVCSDKKEEQKYRESNLNELIIENGKFHKMPHVRNGLFGDYDRLYYLLCLTDTLEPSKRGLDLKKIDLKIERFDDTYSINIIGTKNIRYLNGVEGLKTWLSGVNVKEKGKRIEICIESFERNRFLSAKIV